MVAFSKGNRGDQSDDSELWSARCLWIIQGPTGRVVMPDETS